MENASEALIMAGEILVFILALTFSITSFNTVKNGLDDIIGSTDTITYVQSGEQYLNYIKSATNSSTRIVGVETVVTSMYRALKEDYTLYIKLNSYTNLTTEALKDDNFRTVEATTSIQSEDGTTIINKGEQLIMIGRNEQNALLTRNINQILNDGLYKELSGKKFSEYLGEYQADTDANSANKSTYRIITYVETT